LGNDKTEDSYAPVLVILPGELDGKKVTSLSIGESHNCLISNEWVYCWGDNS
jgi:alpha-tubulin suppressor-like RCC1 family protein